MSKNSQLVWGYFFFLQGQLPGFVVSLAGELDPFFWMKWTVLEMRPDLWTVAVTHLVFITVPTLKMLESPVKVIMHACVAWHVCPQYNYFVLPERHVIVCFNIDTMIIWNFLWYSWQMGWRRLKFTGTWKVNNLSLYLLHTGIPLR